ncbi:MAG: hypothetical protein AB1772_09120 [Candidatus Zixiibacteriota bacterium]
MKKFISARVVTLLLVILVVGVVLNYHKDLIQRGNISSLLAENLDSRLAPHRINRVNRLRAILAHGIRSLEVDLMFRPSNGGGYFEIGHDESDASGVGLAEFLDTLGGAGLKKIWLDIKNITEGNIDAALAELIRLDSLYDLRKTAIVESSFGSESLRRISNAGFHTSFYLPTVRIKELLASGDTMALQKEAEAIAAQVWAQQLAAVSFDLALYSFVKGHLESIIPDTTVYHVWDSVKLWEWDAIRELKDRNYFKDARVATILYEYWGPD